MNVSTRIARRGPLVPTVLVAGGLILAFVVFAGVWVRKLWFDSVSFPQVFTIQLLTQLLLFVAFFLVMAATVGFNMWLAFRMRPTVRRTGQSAVLDRYRDLLESNITVAILVPSVFLGAVAGISAIGSVDGVPRLVEPHLRSARPTPTSGSTSASTSSSTRSGPTCWPSFPVPCSSVSSPPPRSTSRSAESRPDGTVTRPNAARIHLSVLAGLLLVVYGLQNLFDRYGFLLQQGTLFTGMHYTDDHARLTAKLVIALIAFLCAGLFFVNGFLKRWTLPVVGLVLMVVSGADPRPDLPDGRAELPGQAERARPGAVLHRQAHRSHADRRSVSTTTEVTEYEAVTQVSQGQLKEDAEALPGHPADRPRGGGSDVREPAAAARLLLLPRGAGRRPVRDRRQGDRRRGRGARDQRRRLARPELEQPAHRLHPRLRPGGRLRQPAQFVGRSGVDREEPAARG